MSNSEQPICFKLVGSRLKQHGFHLACLLVVERGWLSLAQDSAPLAERELETLAAAAQRERERRVFGEQQLHNISSAQQQKIFSTS